MTVTIRNITTYVNADEMKMLSDYRKEREQILINEQNEKSSNQKAVEGIARLKQYCTAHIPWYHEAQDPVEKIIEWHTGQCEIIAKVQEAVGMGDR